jgi:hypothetical protein
MAAADNGGVNWTLWLKAFGLTFLGCAAVSAAVYSQVMGAAFSAGLIIAFTLFSVGIAAKVATRWVSTRHYKNTAN